MVERSFDRITSVGLQKCFESLPATKASPNARSCLPWGEYLKTCRIFQRMFDIDKRRTWCDLPDAWPHQSTRDFLHCPSKDHGAWKILQDTNQAPCVRERERDRRTLTFCFPTDQWFDPIECQQRRWCSLRRHWISSYRNWFHQERTFEKDKRMSMQCNGKPCLTVLSIRVILDGRWLIGWGFEWMQPDHWLDRERLTWENLHHRIEDSRLIWARHRRLWHPEQTEHSSRKPRWNLESGIYFVGITSTRDEGVERPRINVTNQRDDDDSET